MPWHWVSASRSAAEAKETPGHKPEAFYTYWMTHYRSERLRTAQNGSPLHFGIDILTSGGYTEREQRALSGNGLPLSCFGLEVTATIGAGAVTSFCY